MWQVWHKAKTNVQLWGTPVCKQKDHFGTMCFFKNKNSKVHEIQEGTDSEDEFFVESESEEWRTELETNGVDISYKLDTGSSVNILPIE